MVLSLVKCTVIDLRRRLRETRRCASSLLQPAVVTLGDLPEHEGKPKITTRPTITGKRISLAACITLPSFHPALLGNIERGLCLLCPQALVKTFLIMINYIRIKIPSTKYTNNGMLPLNTTLFINYRAVCRKKNKSSCRERTACHKKQCFSNFHSDLKNISIFFFCKVCPSSRLLCILEVFPLWAQLLWMLFMVLLWQVWRAGVVKDVSLAYLLSVWICYRIVNDPVWWHVQQQAKPFVFPPFDSLW